jgi:hypothetical protein
MSGRWQVEAKRWTCAMRHCGIEAAVSKPDARFWARPRQSHQEQRIDKARRSRARLPTPSAGDASCQLQESNRRTDEAGFQNGSGREPSDPT